MDIPAMAEVTENKIVPRALPREEQYPSEEVRERLRKSIQQADNGEFASDEEVKAFFDKWSDYEG